MLRDQVSYRKDSLQIELFYNTSNRGQSRTTQVHAHDFVSFILS